MNLVCIELQILIVHRDPECVFALNKGNYDNANSADTYKLKFAHVSTLDDDKWPTDSLRGCIALYLCGSPGVIFW